MSSIQAYKAHKQKRNYSDNTGKQGVQNKGHSIGTSSQASLYVGHPTS